MQGTNQLLREISDVMAATVVETFNGMFGQSVVSATMGHADAAGVEGRTSACLILKNDGGKPARIYFTFDDRMLSLTALNFFSVDLSAQPGIRSDIACAVANIVGTKVKNCLNGHGHRFEMTFPFAVPDVEVENGFEAVHLHFAYDDGQGRINDGGVIVNFTMNEQQAA